ncbi:MAG TPA: glycosyltransferase family 2 protein [Verrucomicrobiae bacterium]|nr:glycosyltransferase family 2 protein [Verrucomicrobiae bacterium]
MYRHRKITVCLPCRNEANHLHEVVKRIPKFVDEIIVISNASKDNTVEVAKKLGVKALEDNRKIGGIGYGFAHMTGIENATGDIVVGADGDATYPLEDLAQIIDYLIDHNLDFISCNRYPLQAGVKIPFKLQLGVNVLNWEVRMLYGKKIHDILSGMWVFRNTVTSDLHLTMGDWNLSPQIKINAMLQPNIRFAEYSIAQHQRMGESKQAHYKTGFQHLWWIFKNRLRTRFEWEPVR